MKKISSKEHYELQSKMDKYIRKKLLIPDYAMISDSDYLFFDEGNNLIIGLYILRDSRRFCFDVFGEWNNKIDGVINFYFYLEIDSHFMPVRKEEVIIEKEDLTNFYIVIIRKKKEKYLLEMYCKEKLVFSKCISNAHVKCGIDLKILYTTRKGINYTNWIYKEFKHIPLLTSEFEYYNFSNYLDAQNKKSKFLKDDYIEFVFHYVNCKRFFVAEKFARENGDFFEIIPNYFDDDESVNYIVKFKKEKHNYIAFMIYCLQSEISGYSIYGIPVFELKKGCYRRKSEESLFIEKSCIFEPIDYEKQCREILTHIYNKIGIKPDLYAIPCLPYFEKDKYHIEQVVSYLKEISTDNSLFDYNSHKKTYNIIYEKLIDEGVIKERWKSEFELYKIVKKIYPSSIYQFRAKWLRLQSLDVYIPELNVGIEYQGLQHYKPIEIFGGESGFKYTQKRDMLKKELCDKNNVKLLYWRYDENISTPILMKKLKDAKII